MHAPLWMTINGVQGGIGNMSWGGGHLNTCPRRLEGITEAEACPGGGGGGGGGNGTKRKLVQGGGTKLNRAFTSLSWGGGGGGGGDNGISACPGREVLYMYIVPGEGGGGGGGMFAIIVIHRGVRLNNGITYLCNKLMYCQSIDLSETKTKKKKTAQLLSSYPDSILALMPHLKCACMMSAFSG